MNAISRRDALQLTGVSLLSTLMPVDGRAQSQISSVQNPAVAPVPASKDFADYSAHAIVSNLNLHLTGSLDKAGTRILSQQITLLADHMESTGFDAAFKNYCADPDTTGAIPEQGMPLYTEQMFNAQQTFLKSIPSITPDMYPIQQGQIVGAANMKASYNFIAKYGLSYILKTHADNLRNAPPALASNASFSRKHSHASIEYPVYSPVESAQLLNVSSCSKLFSGLISGWNNFTPAEQCTLITGTAAAMGGAVGGAACALLLETLVGVTLCVLGFALFFILVGLAAALECNAS